ncbi:MAG: hypothetical protein HEQ23_08320 [Tepidisphaera sp.]
MDALQLFKRLASRYPETNPKITVLPTGAAMLDLAAHGVRYCVEFFPASDSLGLSRVEGSSPFWEGVDESFSSPEALEAKMANLLRTQE